MGPACRSPCSRLLANREDESKHETHLRLHPLLVTNVLGLEFNSQEDYMQSAFTHKLEVLTLGVGTIQYHSTCDEADSPHSREWGRQLGAQTARRCWSVV